MVKHLMNSLFRD